mmetsp:Transcript_107589/g.310905  ORF Transcript_107589/g.310905 Transcript_107589/m.310905 type:complete len:449 (+) Transcript_107589:790-2136(+)
MPTTKPDAEGLEQVCSCGTSCCCSSSAWHASGSASSLPSETSWALNVAAGSAEAHEASSESSARLSPRRPRPPCLSLWRSLCGFSAAEIADANGEAKVLPSFGGSPPPVFKSTTSSNSGTQTIEAEFSESAVVPRCSGSKAPPVTEGNEPREPSTSSVASPPEELSAPLSAMAASTAAVTGEALSACGSAASMASSASSSKAGTSPQVSLRMSCEGNACAPSAPSCPRALRSCGSDSASSSSRSATEGKADAGRDGICDCNNATAQSTVDTSAPAIGSWGLSAWRPWALTSHMRQSSCEMPWLRSTPEPDRSKTRISSELSKSSGKLLDDSRPRPSDEAKARRCAALCFAGAALPGRFLAKAKFLAGPTGIGCPDAGVENTRRRCDRGPPSSTSSVASQAASVQSFVQPDGEPPPPPPPKRGALPPRERGASNPPGCVGRSTRCAGNR